MSKQLRSARLRDVGDGVYVVGAGLERGARKDRNRYRTGDHRAQEAEHEVVTLWDDQGDAIALLDARLGKQAGSPGRLAAKAVVGEVEFVSLGVEEAESPLFSRWQARQCLDEGAGNIDHRGPALST